jgi:tetratricopeptide (TPR) repeat protein
MLRLPLAAAAGLALASIAFPTLTAAEEARISKDIGPAGACDRHGKDSAAWKDCVGAAVAGMPDAELFYAGYWFARTGRYREALSYLELARVRDERVLTYIGFATRKLGDVDGALPFYGEALARNPDYTVARAYLGEAHLAKREPEKARAELAEIARRCGTGCPEHADLAAQISLYETLNGRG